VTDEPSSDLVEHLRQGDERAAAEIYARFADRLLALARTRLSKRLAQRLDPEDILQSVYRSFFTRVRDGRLLVAEDHDLWPLLATITIKKVRRQAIRQQAAKRDARLESSLSLGAEEKAAWAMEHAHTRGVLHCDLKPQNVLCDRAGKVWLTDFGYGRVFTANHIQPAPVQAGTWAYMAPEQRTGSQNLGPWTDVYGLGGLFHTLLFGVPPSEPALRDLEIPPSARTLCEKCLAAAPEARYRDAREVLEALASLQI
jgi:tRNA A-37 threonylcarbamoyl transferase component Bud32